MASSLKTQTFAQEFMEQQTQLHEALHAWDEQPEEIQPLYLVTAHQLVEALVQTTSWLTIQLPFLFYQNGHILSVPKPMMLVRIKSLMTLLHRETSSAFILKKLAALKTHSDTIVVQITQLVTFLAARHLVQTCVPDPEQTPSQFFDKYGAPNGTMEEARAGVACLCQFMAYMTLAEQLSPALTADPAYDEKHAYWSNHLVKQGRLLAEQETNLLIDELLTRLKNGELLRGLTLFIPYLDEQRFEMAVYKIVVMPSSRILFHPEFVMGACRLEEQRVRQNPLLSQSTRWQLISQLNQIHQAFETYVHHTS